MKENYLNPPTTNMSEDEWQQAAYRLSEKRAQYVECAKLPGVNVNFVLRVVIDPLLTRYSSGERTEELFKEMMEVE